MFVFAGFIEFIVEPSMAVCADMLEVALAPILAPCKEAAAVIAEEVEPLPCGATSTNSEKPSSALRFTIKKPWVGILTDNKRLWKDQAAKGITMEAPLTVSTGRGRVATFHGFFNFK